jgi:hypothetical protein
MKQQRYEHINSRPESSNRDNWNSSAGDINDGRDAKTGGNIRKRRYVNNKREAGNPERLTAEGLTAVQETTGKQ